MTPDIWRKIQKDFGSDAQDAEEKIQMLSAQSKDLIEDRLVRCIIYLADGNIKNMEDAIKLAQTDYRDVIWQAEYECSETQKRDLSNPFK